MQILSVSQNRQSFGLKMTQRYIEQETKRLNFSEKDIIKSDLSQFMNDNVTLDYKDSKYSVILPQYKVACNFKMSGSYPLVNISKAEYACVRKIMLDSIKKKEIKNTARNLMKSFPWEKERIIGLMHDILFFEANKQ